MAIAAEYKPSEQAREMTLEEKLALCKAGRDALARLANPLGIMSAEDLLSKVANVFSETCYAKALRGIENMAYIDQLSQAPDGPPDVTEVLTMEVADAERLVARREIEIKLSAAPGDVVKLAFRCAPEKELPYELLYRAVNDRFSDDERRIAAAEIMMLLLLEWNFEDNGVPQPITVETIAARGFRTLVFLFANMRPYLDTDGNGSDVDLVIESFMERSTGKAA